MIKTLATLLTFFIVTQAMPRYLIVPISNVQFIHGPAPQSHHRVVRSAWPQEGAPGFAIPVNTNDAIGSARYVHLTSLILFCDMSV